MLIYQKLKVFYRKVLLIFFFHFNNFCYKMLTMSTKTMCSYLLCHKMSEWAFYEIFETFSISFFFYPLSFQNMYSVHILIYLLFLVKVFIYLLLSQHDIKLTTVIKLIPKRNRRSLYYFVGYVLCCYTYSKINLI